MSKRAVVVTIVCTIIFSFSFLFVVADRPLGRVSEPHSTSQKVAAISIRDNVIPFQKFGSKLFTVPALQIAYDQFAYLTDRGDHAFPETFVETVTRLAKENDVVDIFILAHSNRLVRWVELGVPAELRSKIRLVYNTGCADAYQAEDWLRLGAKTYVGHPGRNSVSPVFYVLFLRRWIRGVDAKRATDASNAMTKTRLRWVGGVASGFRFSGDELAQTTHAIASGDVKATIR